MRNVPICLVGLFSVALSLLTVWTWGEEKTPPLFSPSITRVAVFKNGYVFTFREGEAKPNDGWCATTAVPTAVLGTVWGYSLTPKTNVTYLFASEDEQEQTQKVENLQEFLLQNDGAMMRVKTSDKEEFMGRLTVLASRPRTPSPDEMIPGDARPMPPPVISDVAIKTESGVVVLNLSRIAHVQILGEPKWEKTVKVRQRRLALRVEGNQDGQPTQLGVAALERGIRWIPSYRIELKGEKVKEAKLELEASVINDLADVQNADFYFVVGVPHFLLKDTLSPLSLRAAFTGLSSYFAEPSGDISRAMTTQMARMGEGRMAGGMGGGEFQPLPTSLEEERLPALSAEELFLYQAKHLSLKRGSRASLRLFSLTVPCTEVFEWTIPDPPDASSYQRPSSPEQLALESLTHRVWYALRLKNNTNMPWTTGPAMSFREWKPIGQDMMPFTAVGGEAIVKVTPATEVVGEHAQLEKARQNNALTIYGYVWDLVTVEGTIKLRNVKKEPVEVIITRRTEGEIVEASDNASISREGLRLQATNPYSVIKWQLNLPPGEKVLRYTYKRYVRRT